MSPRPSRPEGAVTRGTTAPNRLRRTDRWLCVAQAGLLRSPSQPPLVVDLGFGASPITTVELYRRLRMVRPDVEVLGLEIDPGRVERGRLFLAELGLREDHRGLGFSLGGFELPVPRPPSLIRAFNVLRQYSEDEAWEAWDRMCSALTPDGALIEGTCDEIGRRAVWVTLGRTAATFPSTGDKTGRGTAEPQTITFSAEVSTLERPSELAERLPKTLIHRNIPGERIHDFLSDFDRSWAIVTPQSVFGPRQRWIAAVEHLAQTWPVISRPPAGGRARWRLGEVTLPWEAVRPEPIAVR